MHASAHVTLLNFDNSSFYDKKIKRSCILSEIDLDVSNKKYVVNSRKFKDKRSTISKKNLEKLAVRFFLFIVSLLLCSLPLGRMLELLDL